MTLASEADVNTWPAFSARAHAGSIITKQENAELRVVAGKLSHRIKNLVAVIQSIARQTMRQTDTKEDFEARFSGRLSAFGHSLDLLIANDWRGARVDDLVRLELTPFGLLDRVQISVEGPLLALSSVAARNIGLALHELATNASKYGALSVPEGEVAVHWALASRGGEKRFHMTWCESGGPIVTEPTHRGFGRQIIQHVPAQALVGKVTHEFLPAGVRWTLDIPAAIAVASPGNGRTEALQPVEDGQTRDMAYASGVRMREDRRRYEYIPRLAPASRNQLALTARASCLRVTNQRLPPHRRQTVFEATSVSRPDANKQNLEQRHDRADNAQVCDILAAILAFGH